MVPLRPAPAETGFSGLTCWFRFAALQLHVTSVELLKATLTLAPSPAKELARYLASFPQESERLADLAALLQTGSGKTWFDRSKMEGHLTSSALVLNHQKTHVLLVHHRALQTWLQPGGHYEGSGTLAASALREVQEETGVADLKLLRWVEGASLLDVTTLHVPERAERAETEHLHHDFLYLAQAPLSAQAQPQLAEVLDAQWVPVQELHTAQSERLRRVAEKLDLLLQEQAALAVASAPPAPVSSAMLPPETGNPWPSALLTAMPAAVEAPALAPEQPFDLSLLQPDPDLASLSFDECDPQSPAETADDDFEDEGAALPTAELLGLLR